MNKITMSTKINAPAEKVWKTLWDDKTYRQWTSVFSPGSYAESEWNEGSKIKFLGAGENGMYGFIDKKEENRQMTFRHMGEVKNGQETESEWVGATEDYKLTEANGSTELVVEMDAIEEMEKYFRDTFPKALALVKEIAETEE